MLEQPNDLAIARSVVGLGNILGMAVIAAGVESEEQMHRLTEEGCGKAQGYFISRPLNADDFAAFVAALNSESDH